MTSESSHLFIDLPNQAMLRYLWIIGLGGSFLSAVLFLVIFACIFTQVIGDGNLIMGSCHIAHDCKVGNNNILANNTLVAGHVVIEVISSPI